MLRGWLGVALVMTALAGCQGSEEDEMSIEQRTEQRAAELREYVDDLVDRLGGTGVQVVGDETIECDLTDPEGGLEHGYRVRFIYPEGAVEVLEGAVADAREAEGWTVRRDPGRERQISVRFLRDSFSTGVQLAVGSDGATAGGSTGCVR